MLVHDLVAAAVRERPDHPAIVDGEATLTWGQLDEATERAAAWLAGRGVVAGDRVAYAGADDRRFLVLCYATLRMGAIFVPLHSTLTAAQVGYVAANSEARVVVCDVDLPAAPGQVVPAARAWAEIEATAPVAPAARSADDDAIAFLIYTSGTTGEPKGVVCPHRQVVAAAAAIQTRLSYRDTDVVLCRLPLSFDYGLYQALLCAQVGATLVLADRVGDGALLHMIEREGVTVVPLVPSLAQMLLLLQRRHRRSTAVRLFTNTGARLGRDIGAQLLDLFPGTVYASMYGMTECKRIAILDPAEYAAHPDSVGPPIPGLTVRIVGPSGEDLPTGAVGEIVVHGTTVMAGYWRMPLSAQRRYVARPDGSLELHTGDNGRLDAEGRLSFVGRDDDMVKRRGIRISLTEIENAAELVPGVSAAVAVRPVVEGGPLRLAVLGSASPEEIKAALVARLDPARRPDQIVAIPTVPLTRNGKPDRKAVAHLLDVVDQAVPPLAAPLAQNRIRHAASTV